MEKNKVNRRFNNLTDDELKEFAFLATQGDMFHIDGDWEEIAKQQKMNFIKNEKCIEVSYKDPYSNPKIIYEVIIFSDFSIIINENTLIDCIPASVNMPKLISYLIDKGFNVFNTSHDIGTIK